jgi:type I restriction enzyme S subunit
MGPFGSDIKVENFVKSGVPVLNGSNLSKFKLVEDEFKYLLPEKAKDFKKATARAGDLVITHRGTLGQISYVPKKSKFPEYVISQSQFKVTLNPDELDPVYAVYYFHTLEGQQRLLANKCHVGVPALAQATTNFRRIEIPIPPIETQRKVASVLSNLDLKIELNNELNKELNRLADLIYSYWFVQFEFPNKDNVSYKNNNGKMKWCELSKKDIPIGWHTYCLRDVIANFKNGDWGSEVKEGNYSQKVSCIRGADINGILGLEECDLPSRYILEKNKEKILDPYELVVEISGGSPSQSTGRLAYITDSTLNRFENKLICSNFCKAISLKEKRYFYNFVHHWNSLYKNKVFFNNCIFFC